MKLRSARIALLRFPLRAPLRTAHGALAERRSALVELVDERGRRGYGEAAPIDGFPGESFEAAADALGALSPALEAGECATPAALEARLPIDELPLAHGAVATARLDLEARAHGVSMAAHLVAGLGNVPAMPSRPAVAQRIEVNALLSSAEPSALAEEGRRAVAEGYRTLKVKIGAQRLDRDLARLRALREAVGPDARIRADANAAWSLVEAERACEALAEFDLECLEQPVPPEETAALLALASESAVPIAADESAASASGARTVVRDGRCRGLVLKPALVGGPLAALELAAEALRAGMTVVVTSLIDAAIGRAAALHVAAALPALVPAEERAKIAARAHGLATGGLLADDLCEPAHEVLRDGALSLPAQPGLGVVPDAAALERLRWERPR